LLPARFERPLRTLNAFGYLTWHTLWNRTYTRIRRAKNPRYALSAIIGAVYFWFFLVRNPSQMPRELGSTFANSLSVLATLGLVAFMSTWWLFGGDKTTLAFSLPETAFLFPAPLTRRAVIGYKLFRAQLAILINAVIFIFLLRRGIGFLPPGYRAISLWVLFTTMNFHRVGAALVRASWVEHQRQAFRRTIVPTLVLLTVLIGVGVALNDAWPEIGRVVKTQGIFDAAGVARRMLDQFPANVVLWPIHALIAPVFAMSRYEWAAAIPSAFLVLLLHAWWVVRTDAAFEESAIAASYERAKRIEAFRSRRMLNPPTEKMSRRAIRLPTWGHPAVAIVWKNFICLRRTFQFRIFLAPLVMAAVWGWAAYEKEGWPGAITVGTIAFAGLFTFFGPMLIRNDLRQDMQNIVALKVLPLSGRTIVLAEVLSAAIPVALLQFVAILIAGIASSLRPDPPPVSLVATVYALSLPAALVFQSAMVSVMNGAPVLFPGWVRLGAVAGGGMENLGQGVMSMGIVFILVALMMLVPAGFIALSVIFLRPLGPALVALTAMLAASSALAVEIYGVFIVLGRALERTEPSETAAA